jgi:molecular chaperone DnaK
MTTSEAQAVIGIDLGTSNSVVAGFASDPSNPNIVFTDPEGNTIQPSVISLHPNGAVLVGPAAKKRRLMDPKNTLFSIKRLMGRDFQSRQVQQLIGRFPFVVREGKNSQPVIVTRGRLLSPPQVSAIILRHMKKMAEKKLGHPVSKAVITVPANFNDAQRQATKLAGRMAKLDVLRIINEPTAAALAYGHGQSMEKTVLLYDFGGGTFDVTILRITRDIFEVLATAGDTQLGGDDVDERICEAMIENFMRTHHYDLNHNEMAMLRLRGVAEQIKCQLSSKEKAAANIQELAYGPGGKPLSLDFVLSRASLESMCADLVIRTLEICDEAFALAQMNPSQVDGVVLVGGSTRMPLVRREVEKYFGQKPQCEINPDEVVAIGAAIQGGALIERPTKTTAPPLALLLDVIPKSLGLATVGGYTSVVIPRNAQLPTEQSRTFTTGADFQDTVSIKVCQGEQKKFEQNTILGELTLSGLRPAPRGEVKVEVTFEIDTDGILCVNARDLDTGIKQHATMQLVGVSGADESAEQLEETLGEETDEPAGLPGA